MEELRSQFEALKAKYEYSHSLCEQKLRECFSLQGQLERATQQLEAQSVEHTQIRESMAVKASQVEEKCRSLEQVRTFFESSQTRAQGGRR